MTPSITTLHRFANLLPNWTLLPILTLLPKFGGFQKTLQRVRLANRGRLLLRTPGPVPFGTCICSNGETILSWTCHVHGPFEFWTSLGTSILLYNESLLIIIIPVYQTLFSVCCFKCFRSPWITGCTKVILTITRKITVHTTVCLGSSQQATHNSSKRLHVSPFLFL